MIFRTTITDREQRQIINAYMAQTMVAERVFRFFDTIDCGQEPTKIEQKWKREFETNDLMVIVQTVDRQPQLVGGV